MKQHKLAGMRAEARLQLLYVPDAQPRHLRNHLGWNTRCLEATRIGNLLL